MTLSRCIEEYVRHRRSLGVCFHGEQVRLSALVKSVGDKALVDVTPEAIRRYIDGKGPVTQSWFCRFHTVAGFYRFAMARQYTDHAPLPPRPPKPPAEFIPYIYSEQDVRALLDAVDARYEEDWLVRPQTVRTLLLLLYVNRTGFVGGLIPREWSRPAVTPSHEMGILLRQLRDVVSITGVSKPVESLTLER